MRKIYIPIDNKSLFINIFNDNRSGHTPTVCTPIVQGNSTHEAVKKIFRIPHQIDFNSDDGLNDFLNKSSKSTTKVTNVFLFPKITINGLEVENEKPFCFFVKEEIDPEKVQFGRTKLHYPTSFKYNGKFQFDNKHVFSKLSDAMHGYAFVVRGFFYDFDLDVLDFDADIVGYRDIPYSKVFISTKGAGNKYIQGFHDLFDNYDIESIALKQHFGYDYVNPDNYIEKLMEMKKVAFKLLSNEFEKNEFKYSSDEYPYSLFDINYRKNGIKRYCFVSYSATKETYINLSIKQWQFINEFSDYIDFYIINNIYDKPRIVKLSYDEIINLNRAVTSLTFKK